MNEVKTKHGGGMVLGGMKVIGCGMWVWICGKCIVWKGLWLMKCLVEY